jgi:hypothetical protein
MQILRSNDNEYLKIFSLVYKYSRDFSWYALTFPLHIQGVFKC